MNKKGVSIFACETPLAPGDSTANSTLICLRTGIPSQTKGGGELRRHPNALTLVDDVVYFEDGNLDLQLLQMAILVVVHLVEDLIYR